MINQPEEVKKLSVTLSLMRQEMDVLKESKIKISSEIREKIREKQDIVLEIPELKKSIEMKRKELEVISMKLLEQEKLSKANEAVLQEIKAEHDLLSKEIGEMREELLMRENKMNLKEGSFIQILVNSLIQLLPCMV